MRYVLSIIAAIFIFSLICHPAFAGETEEVVLHITVEQKEKIYYLNLESIRDLATIVANVKNSHQSTGNDCAIDIYFNGDDSTHVHILCKKMP